MTIIPLSKADIGSKREQRVPFKPERLKQAKAAFSTHRVRWEDVENLLIGDLEPRAGDLVLARIERLGQHKRIELATGRRAHLHVGDEVILCYGGRYAPDQFEAIVPSDMGRCDMVAAGGIAARCRVRHGSVKQPTRIEPIGLLADARGRRINLSSYALKPAVTRAYPAVYAVVGTMMNAGKTTTAALLLRGLRARGMKVGAAKVTGTGAGCDRWVYTDAGADSVLDFTDVGEASTYGLHPHRLEEIFSSLVDIQADEGMDAIVVEVADGLFQCETAALLSSEVFRSRCEGVFFASRDALGALAGVTQLQQMGLEVLGVSGAMTASPLATQEAKGKLGAPVMNGEELSSGAWLEQEAAVTPQREEA